MTDRADRMFAEVDRQLEAVRAQSEGIATRAGLLLSATALGAALVGALVKEMKPGVIVALAVLGLASILGVAVVVPQLAQGPVHAELTSLLGLPNEDVANERLLFAKMLKLEGDKGRLGLMTGLFIAQAVIAVLSIVLAVVFVAVR